MKPNTAGFGLTCYWFTKVAECVVQLVHTVGPWSWDLKQKHEVLKSIRGIGPDPKATTLTGQWHTRDEVANVSVSRGSHEVTFSIRNGMTLTCYSHL